MKFALVALFALVVMAAPALADCAGHTQSAGMPSTVVADNSGASTPYTPPKK